MLLGPEFDSINSVKYLYLRELSEPKDNSLRIILQEAIDNRAVQAVIPDDFSELREILKDSWPIESTAECKTFELTWNHCAAYLVTEELVGSSGQYEDETYTGNLLRVYTKSHFLDHLTRDTGGHLDPIQHFKLICLNHLIDIAAYIAPEIRVIDPNPPKSPRIH